MAVPKLYQAVQASIAGPLHRQIRAHLAKVVPDEPSVHVLDVGCGVGDYAGVFERAAYRGIDLDAHYIAAARRERHGSNATFEVGDARALPFADGQFDYCISVGLYHHLADAAVVASLRDALRVSAPGNVLVFDAIFPPRGNWIGYALRRLDRGKHVRFLPEYEGLLRSHFQPAEIRAERAGLLDYIFFRL